MPITREFIFEDNGLIPAEMENADPGSGRTVAHDILEHFCFQGDPVENELLALGALYLLRLESGAQRTNYELSLATLLARNVMDVLRDLMENEDLQPPRRRRVVGRAELPCDVVLPAVGQAFAGLDQAMFDEPSWSAERKQQLVAHKAGFEDWLLAGYKRAVQRFAQSDAFTVGSHLFEEVARKTDELLTNAYMLQHGDHVRISVDLRTFEVNLRMRNTGHSRWFSPAYG